LPRSIELPNLSFDLAAMPVLIRGNTMRGLLAIAVVGLTFGCWTSDATAQSSKISGSSAKTKSAVERTAANSAQQVETKTRAAAVRHDADPSADLASLKAAEPQTRSKFTVPSKVSGKIGVALAAAQARGDGETAKTADAASKFSGGVARAVSRTERQPDAVNAPIKP
jgi:hypothetical protein